MKSALFILPVATQPRFSKRINSFLSQNIEVTVATFERDYFNLNKLPEGVNIESLGKIESGNYLKRIPKLINSIRKIINLSKDKNIIYIFSVDVLVFTGLFFRKKKLIYEIGDIREFTKNKYVAKFFHYIYMKILNKCTSIIVTSSAFKDYFLTKYSLNNEQIKVIENKLQNGPYFNPSEKIEFKQIESKYTIGIIGYLRYINTVNFLKAYDSYSDNKFDIIIFGDGQLKNQILEYVNNKSVRYYGQFKYPDDIKSIYEKFDLSFTMYDSTDLNVRLAIPNKLYESMYFKKPIIVSSNTYLSNIVDNLGIGIQWNQNDMMGLVKYLNSKDFFDSYKLFENKLNRIDREVYLSD